MSHLSSVKKPYRLLRKIAGEDYTLEVVFFDYGGDEQGSEEIEWLKDQSMIDFFQLQEDVKKEVIEQVYIYTTPIKMLPISFHAYVVFLTNKDGQKEWWSIEKTDDHIIQQRSDLMQDVVARIKGDGRAYTPHRSDC